MPHQIAISRAAAARQRLATAHEGLLLCIVSFVRLGLVPDRDPRLTLELREFDLAIRGRYAAASLLWNVLGDMKHEEWFGRGNGMVDVTLRRLGTLKGLEASSRCWEGVVLGLVEIVERVEGDEEGKGEEKRGGEWEEQVRRVMGGWRRGLPSRP